MLDEPVQGFRTGNRIGCLNIGNTLYWATERPVTEVVEARVEDDILMDETALLIVDEAVVQSIYRGLRTAMCRGVGAIPDQFNGTLCVPRKVADHGTS